MIGSLVIGSVTGVLVIGSVTGVLVTGSVEPVVESVTGVDGSTLVVSAGFFSPHDAKDKTAPDNNKPNNIFFLIIIISFIEIIINL